MAEKQEKPPEPPKPPPPKAAKTANRSKPSPSGERILTRTSEVEYR